MKINFSLLFLFTTLLAQAQLQRNFTSYTVDNGLSQNTVWETFQDYKGYMWFGTADGLNRFDGYKMIRYKPRKDDSTSLSGNSTFKFCEDSKKNLWISHVKGVSIYNRAKDCFINLPQTSKDIKASAVLGEDKRGHMWCINGYHQLVGFSIHDFSVYKIIPFSKGNLMPVITRTYIQSGKYIIGFVNDSNKNNTLFKFNTETEQLQIVNHPKQFKGFLLLYNDSTVCAISNDTLCLYTIFSNTFENKPIVADKVSLKASTANSMVWWQHKIYVGTDKGLFVLNPKTNSFEEHIITFNKTEKVGYFYVDFLYVDKSKNLWIGTDGAGAKCLSSYQNKFKHYASTESRNSLVKAISTDRDGNIYAGLYAQGLLRFTANGTVEQFKFGKTNSEMTHVLAITNWNKRILLVNDKLLKEFTPATKVFKDIASVYIKNPFNTADRITYPFFKQHNNQLFVGCDMAVSEILTNGKVSPILTIEIRDSKISSLEIINDTTWWVGTTNRLFQFNPISKIQKTLLTNPPIKTICFCRKTNDVWVGGNDGLFRLSVSGNLLKQYDLSDGLPDDFIYGILEDKYGRVWISHNKGMSVYFPHTKTFKHFGVKDGLQSNEFNTGAYYKDEKGLLYFGGVNGVNIIDPDNIIENKNRPQISINEILVDDLPFQFDTAFNEIHTINLSYLQNTLSFDFSALEFSNPENNTYRYKMEGYDHNWIESGTKHFARYANLPPGNYTLKIKAANGDGVWNEVSREIYITITPPYWQTLWFYILMIVFLLLAITAIVYAFFSRQKVRLKRELEIQQKLEDERLRISRDLHDNVGAQLSFLITNVEWMLEHPEQVNKAEEKERLQALSETGRNAILTLRQTIWAISHASLTIEDFADRFKQFALKMVEFNKAIQLHFAENFETTKTLSPAVALNLFRICQEAFNNSLKHAQCKTIHIAFSNNEANTFVFSITDDGVGFEWDEAVNKGHYGLLNMKARAEETGAVLTIQSEKGKGTTLTLTVK